MCGEFSFEHSVPVQTRLHLMLTAILQHGDLGNNVREVYLIRHDGWVVVNLGVNLWHEMATKEEKQPGQRFKNNVANLNWNPNPGKKGHESPSRDVKWICWSLRGDVTCVPWFSWRHKMIGSLETSIWSSMQRSTGCSSMLVYSILLHDSYSGRE